METPEEVAAKEYAEAGVDLPELQETPKEEPAPEPVKPEEPKEPEPAPVVPAEEPKAEAHLQEPEEPRKRSIYDEYKKKKDDLKVETELREQAERERDEYRQKLEALTNAAPGKDTTDAEKDLRTLVTERGADPDLVERIIQEARKGIAPDPSLVERIEKFEAWQRENASVIEKQKFDEEFAATVPTLKELLPNASDEEMQEVKKHLDKLSHTTAYHDKPLDYVAFKHKTELSALISPKKRGLEPKARVDAGDVPAAFDPNADLSKMTPAQREAWETEYHKLGKSEGLVEDSTGRKILI